MRILIVEDDPKIATFLQNGLSEEDYNVSICNNGREGLENIRRDNFDLIILDIILPEKSGIDICKEMRDSKIMTPVIMLTARDSVENKIEGLDAGADDYLTKPFSFEELLSRVKALLRRTQVYESGTLKVSDLEYNPLTGDVNRAGKEIALSGKEYALLEYFMRNKGVIITESMLIENIWGQDYYAESNIIKVYIHHLRQKVDKDFTKKLIHTIKGIGYKMEEK